MARAEHARATSLADATIEDCPRATPRSTRHARDASFQLLSTIDERTPLSERLSAGLRRLGQQVQARGGALWIHTGAGLMRPTEFGCAREDGALEDWAHRFFKREVVEYVTDAADTTESSISADLRSADGLPYMPILLGHDDTSSYVFTGLVVLLGGNAAEARLVAGLATESSRTVAQLEEQRA